MSEEKIRLIWDDCTPTKERRPTTESDIWDDIHIEEFNSKDEFAAFIIGHFLDGDDLEEYGEDPFAAALNFIEISNDDPGDGSPNFLYVSVACSADLPVDSKLVCNLACWSL